MNLTLKITTIGNLLLNNKISRLKEEKPIENIRLIIPEYHRPFIWTARNAFQLLDDIIACHGLGVSGTCVTL